MDKLYKRTSTGATQVWWMEQSGGQYRTHSGQLDGAITTSAWTVCEGKNIGRSNETTPEEQAAKEIEAQYTLKRKKGYTDSPDAAQASTKFSPMLAKKFDDYEDRLFKGKRIFSQPKLDGIRCIATAGGLFSRTGNAIVSVPHIMEALAPVFEMHPNLILDGELYNHDLCEDFNTIVSLSKKSKPTVEDLAESKRLIQYWVYDSPASDDFSSRAVRVDNVVQLVGLPLVKVDTHEVHTREELDRFYQMHLSDGFEGQIVRVNASYQQKRTDVLLKRKEFVDSEFEVVNIEEGVGNGAGIAKRAFLRLDIDPSRTFKADIVGTREWGRQVLAKKDSLIGKQVTVIYFKQRTPDGIPRFGKIKAFHETERW